MFTFLHTSTKLAGESYGFNEGLNAMFLADAHHPNKIGHLAISALLLYISSQGGRSKVSNVA